MKKIICLLSILALLLSCTAVFASCGKSADVPTYKGMTIKKKNSKTMSAEEIGFAFCDADGSDNTVSQTEGNTAEPETPEEDNSDTEGTDDPTDVPKEDSVMDDHVDSSENMQSNIDKIADLDVIADDEVKYFVSPGETFIIEIQLSNPKNFEIQSFTLNGQKYADYMFKEGSTMETLRLEVTAPKDSGYTEYTIDAIKYIDGTQIKDVDMSSGNKTVKAGVAYTKSLGASVSPTSISTTSIDLSVKISEHPALNESSKLGIYLSDGKKIIDAKQLQVGSNSVSFTGLMMAKTYEYGIVAYADMIDGNTLNVHWIAKDMITTASMFEIKNVVASKRDITFEVNEIVDGATITKISLYDAMTNMLVKQGDASCREFKNLLSEHHYNLYVDFTYQSGDEEISDWIAVELIQTLPLTKAQISRGNTYATATTVGCEYQLTDPDKIIRFDLVELYKDDTLVKSNTDGKLYFENLDSYTEYKMLVYITFDFNDGSEPNTVTEEYYIKTHPTMTYTGFTVLSSSPITYGGKILLQINIDNPSRVRFEHVVINGVYCSNITTSNTKGLLCEIINEGQFGTGETTMTIESISGWLDSEIYAIKPKENNSTSMFICGTLDVESLDVVVSQNTGYVKMDYAFPSDKPYLMLTLDNDTKYNIDSVVVSGVEYTNLKKIDDEHYLIEIGKQFYSNWQSRVWLEEINYSIGSYKDSSGHDISCNGYLLKSDTVNYISSAKDLMNITGDCVYCELKNDIDLSGVNWQPKEFHGVFNGAGHSIKNLKVTSGNIVGLFSIASGIIFDLNMKGLNITLDENQDDISPGYEHSVGGIVGLAEGLIMKSCTVDNTSTLYVSSDSIYRSGIGALVGRALGSVISDCTSYAQITSERGLVGGIVGDCEFDDSVVINCTNHGKITGTDWVGGIGARNGMFEKCINYGEISGQSYVGGIVGSCNINENITDCENHGTVSADEYAGGIAGGGGSIANCKNNATVSGDNYVGGIAGLLYNYGKITNCENHGAVDGEDYIGGILGGIQEYSSNTEISYCENYGKVDGEKYVAGIAGALPEKIFACINGGNISGELYVAGIAGKSLEESNNRLDITNCLNTGNVSGEDVVGGIVGYCNDMADLSHCISFGKISGDSSVGGVVGEYRKPLMHCASYGDILLGGYQVYDINGINGMEYDRNCNFVLNDNATANDFNSKSFYIEKLGFSEEIWNLDELDVKNGKFPTPKN